MNVGHPRHLEILLVAVVLASCSSSALGPGGPIDVGAGGTWAIPAGTGGSTGGTDSGDTAPSGWTDANATEGDSGGTLDTEVVLDLPVATDLPASDAPDPADVPSTADSAALEANAPTEAGEAGRGEAGASTGCPCVAGVSATWDCFCANYVFDCSETLDPHVHDAGATVADYTILEEYDNCGLTVVSNRPSVNIPPTGNSTSVFDQSSGALVGKDVYAGLHSTYYCMSAGQPYSGGVRMTAGKFPDATCVLSKCVAGSKVGWVCPVTDGGQ